MERGPSSCSSTGAAGADGTKDDYEFVASSIAREGYVVVIPGLPPSTRRSSSRRSPKTRRKQSRGSKRKSVPTAGTIAASFLAGHSAGAHLAAMVTFDKALLTAAGGSPDALGGFIGIAGPYDFLPLDEGSELQQIFPKATRAESQPVHHVRAAPEHPSILLLHGTSDERVIPRNTRRLAKKAQDAGVDVTCVLYDGVGHKRIVAALAPLLESAAPTRTDVLRWLGARSASPRK